MLIALLVALQVADLVTTIAGLRRGYREVNPLLRAIIGRFGIAGLVIAKVGLTAAMVAIGGDIGIAVCCALLAVVVGLNIRLLVK